MSVPARFVHIYFEEEPEIEAAKVVFNTALDWIKYGSHSWILYSNVELDTWRDRIKTKLVPGDHTFFINEFEKGRDSGYLTKSVWDWLNKTR